MRVSYSILEAWASGDWDRAVAPFVGQEIEANEWMKRGKRWHSRFERETKRTKKSPAVFGGEDLHDFTIELQTKRKVRLNDWLELSGVLDRKDIKKLENGGEWNRGTDYKISKSNATHWANSMQGKVYKILYPELDVFEFRCLNPYLANDDPDRVTMSIVHLDKASLVDGLEWVITHATDLRHYLEQNNISIERE